MADRPVENPAPPRKWGGVLGAVTVVIVGLVLLVLATAALPIVRDLTAPTTSYQRALRSRGWTLQPLQTNTGSDLQGREFRSGELSARRGDFTYAVLYEGGPALQGGGTHVAVHVSRD